MVRGRPAVLGLCGLVLAAMIAAALRIHSLEQRVASLEKASRAPATVAASPVNGLTWAPEDRGSATLQLPDGNRVVTSRLPKGAQLPRGTTAHEINGMTYYVMPLAESGNAVSRR
jgi:hypothetical protein